MKRAEVAVKRLRPNAHIIPSSSNAQLTWRRSAWRSSLYRSFTTSVSRQSDKESDTVQGSETVTDAVSEETKTASIPVNIPADDQTSNIDTVPRKRSSAGRSRRLKRYKPNISPSFIQSHFTPAADNSARSDTIDYCVPPGIFEEALLCIRGGLSADSHRSRTSPIVESLSTRKRHVLLDCPIEGSTRYLNQVIQAAAGEIGADLITFDGQDIMELTEDIWHQSHTASLSRVSTDDSDGFSPSPFPYEQKTDIESDPFQSHNPRVEVFESTESNDDDGENTPVGAIAFDNTEEWQDNQTYKRRNGLFRRLDDKAKPNSQEQSIMEKLVVFFSTLIDARPANRTIETTASQSPSITPCIVHFKDVSDFLETDRHLSYLLLSSLIASINHRHVTRPTILVASYTPSVIMSPLSSAATAITKVTGGLGGMTPSPLRALFDRIGMSPSAMRDQKTADQISVTKQEWDRAHIIDSLSELETGGVGDKSVTKKEKSDNKSGDNNVKPLNIRLGLTNISEIVMDGAKGEKNNGHMGYTLPPGIAIWPGHLDAVLDRLVRIGIPPPLSVHENAEKIFLSQHFEQQREKQIVDINTRSLIRVIARKGVAVDVNQDLGQHIDRFNNRVWSFERLNRLAILTLGVYEQQVSRDITEEVITTSADAPKKSTRSSKVTLQHVVKAAELLRANAETRREWAVDQLRNLESKSMQDRAGSLVFDRPFKVEVIRDSQDDNDTSKEPQTKTSRVVINKRDLDTHEAKLLNRVVDPEMLHTTFKNVQVTPNIIKTLRSVITLPLLYPQDFSYGVLQRHFISGVLLFGPPGTGKTLLAKAVAKESGARMIEIKASDVFDMYVGEGEKNVQAIFSLARKISPCVVFLDEVDALFGARRSDMHNQNHREIINQFMLEWDGLSSNNSGVLLMGATNRPFDLDDAILRRMPRRILIDLPTKADRKAILENHLADENLASDVDLESIAERTPLFSGSDLKNVCVSAALDAVREVVGDLESGGSLPELPTTRRVLHLRHFETALKEITPSCSEDMASLTELRKWDNLYGDGGAARSKKWSGIGFEEITKPKLNVR